MIIMRQRIKLVMAVTVFCLIMLVGCVVIVQVPRKKQPELEQKGLEKSIPLPSDSGGVWREPLTGMEFVWIEGGCFEREGLSRVSNKGPIYAVCVDGFWMGKYEVTNAQYRMYKSGHNSKDFEGHSLNGDDQPVVYVNWNEAKEFTRWLSGQSDDGYEFRLPTEAEWEYAARAGTTTVRYWGDNPDEACGYANVRDRTAKMEFDWSNIHDCDDGYAVAAQVGSFKPNAFGLYDIMGNVWEWCEDKYSKDMHNRNNPLYTGSGSYKVLRGGSWFNDRRLARCVDRVRNDSDYRDINRGFRCVRRPKAVSGH